MNKKIILWVVWLMSVIWIVVYASHTQTSCNEKCQATKHLQEMITEAQLDYMEKKTEYETQQALYFEKEKQKEKALKTLNELFSKNRQLLDSGFTKNQQVLKLDKNYELKH